MDRNSIIGIILIVGILFGSYLFLQPSEQELKQIQLRRDSIAQIESQKALQEASDLDMDSLLAGFESNE